MVEHDREVLAGADQLLDFRPGGRRWRRRTIIAQGTPHRSSSESARPSLTGQYLLGQERANPRLPTRDGCRSTADRQTIRPAAVGWRWSAPGTTICAASIVRIPLGTLDGASPACSGSGKSSLIEDMLYKSLARTLHRARTLPGAARRIRGLEQINKVIVVDQTSIGNTPTSNPATYTGVFDLIRELFAQLPEARVRGYQPAPFQFQSCRAAAARTARGTAKSASRCTSCPTCGSSAKRATASVTIPKRWPYVSRALDCRRARHADAARPSSCSRTFPRFAACCKRCATSGSTISRSASRPRRFRGARPSG